MKRLQSVSAAIGLACGLLALSTSTGCPIVAPGDPSNALFFHPLLLVVGAVVGFLALVRSRLIEREMWRIVDDSDLTRGERELAHREAGYAKRTSGTMFLVGPLGLGLWLAYLFKGEELGIAELLAITPLAGFGLGLAIGALRFRRKEGPEAPY